jgi:hypothetical protein
MDVLFDILVSWMQSDLVYLVKCYYQHNLAISYLYKPYVHEKSKFLP